MNTEHDSDYVTSVTTVDTHRMPTRRWQKGGDVVTWYFSEYQPHDADATWWQIGESEGEEPAYFFDEGEAWDYWNELINVINLTGGTTLLRKGK